VVTKEAIVDQEDCKFPSLSKESRLGKLDSVYSIILLFVAWCMMNIMPKLC